MVNNKIRQLLASNRGRGHFNIATEGDEATVYLYDMIVDSDADAEWWGGVSAEAFAKTFAGIKASTIHLRVNSPGGSVFGGRAMETAIRQHSAKVIAHVDGLAASAASFLIMGADEIEMAPGAFLMIHKAWGYVVGNEDDFRAAGDLFAKFDGALSDIYVARTKKPAAEVAALMRAETWMAPQEAVALGFADKVDETLKGEPAPNTTENRALAARRQTEAALAKAGHSRTSRAALLGDLGAAPRDASRQTNEAPLDASLDLTALAAFAAEMKGFATKLRS